MKPATILIVTLIMLFSSTLSFSNNELSSDEMALARVMHDKGAFPEDVNIEEITSEELKFYQAMIKEYGIDDIRSWKPDPRFSSPESTWSTYIEALYAEDYDLVKKCYIPDAVGDAEILFLEMLRELDPKVRKEIIEILRFIEKVDGDDRSAKYLLITDEDGYKITNYIDFFNMYGEWKFEDF